MVPAVPTEPGLAMTPLAVENTVYGAFPPVIVNVSVFAGVALPRPVVVTALGFTASGVGFRLRVTCAVAPVESNTSIKTAVLVGGKATTVAVNIVGVGPGIDPGGTVTKPGAPEKAVNGGTPPTIV